MFTNFLNVALLPSNLTFSAAQVRRRQEEQEALRQAQEQVFISQLYRRLDSFQVIFP